jgi:hypothetical protein
MVLLWVKYSSVKWWPDTLSPDGVVVVAVVFVVSVSVVVVSVPLLF